MLSTEHFPLLTAATQRSNMVLTLITGPARSGKSEWAEQLAHQSAQASQKQVIYIATAQTYPNDAEWQTRIEKHRQRRPPQWHCQEVPTALDNAIEQFSTPDSCLLIDSLGTWLANLIEQDNDTWTNAQQGLIASLSKAPGDIILVAEETGWGVVPAYEMGRTFRDRLGNLSRSVGAIATDVYLVTGGYALNISTLGQRINSNP